MLDKSEIIKRIPFDPKSQKHRKAVYNFINTGKWDIFFEIPKNCTNLPYSLMVALLLQIEEWETQEAQNRECADFVGALCV